MLHRFSQRTRVQLDRYFFCKLFSFSNLLVQVVGSVFVLIFTAKSIWKEMSKI